MLACGLVWAGCGGEGALGVPVCVFVCVIGYGCVHVDERVRACVFVFICF